MRIFPLRPSVLKTELLTDKGLRENNEDSCTAERLASNTYLLAVADGMGGKEGGEIASQTVITAISASLHEEFAKPDGPEKLKECLTNAYRAAQAAVADKIASRPDLKGMGTTLTILLVHKDRYVWGNIGDSRLYSRCGGRMKLVTSDHSYIREFMNSHGKELPQSVLNQYSNIVTRIIDGGNDEPDLYPSGEESSVLAEGDLFLLCTDGLITDKVKDQTARLEEVVIRNKNLRKIAQDLVDSALADGSDDNITVVLGLFGALDTKPVVEDFQTVKIMVNPKTSTG